MKLRVPRRDSFRRLLRAYHRFGADDCMLLSAAIAYYAFMSLFPLCLLSIALLGYAWQQPQAVDYTLRFASELLPANGVKVVGDAVATIAEDRSKLGIVGVVTLLWLGRVLFEALEISLNRLWQVHDHRRAVRRTVTSLGMVLVAGLVILAEGVASGILSWLQVLTDHWRLRWFPQLPIDQVVFWQFIHSWILVPVTVFAFCMLLYRRAPRNRTPWAQTVPGALFACLAWKLSSVGYFWYLGTLAQSSPVYGSIWGMVGMLVWFYICAAVFLFGAELILSATPTETATA